MSGAAAWRIEGEVGCLSCGPLDARVEADGLGVRLLVATWRGMPSDAFGALITAGPGPRAPVIEIKERYVRGCDFIATYARTDDFPVAPQFYWRAAQHASHSAVQIQMILSVQTDLLDSHPEASVNSFALESQLFHASKLHAAAFEELMSSNALAASGGGASREHLFVFRNENLGLSYAQMVHPSDFVAVDWRVEQSRPPLVSSTLFPESLEKGVIRRARISGWFLPAENDLAAAVQLAQQFVDEPLPLTA
jgi:hypothetical protein